jgi:hypothetical protein
MKMGQKPSKTVLVPTVEVIKKEEKVLNLNSQTFTLFPSLIFELKTKLQLYEWKDESYTPTSTYNLIRSEVFYLREEGQVLVIKIKDNTAVLSVWDPKINKEEILFTKVISKENKEFYTDVWASRISLKVYHLTVKLSEEGVFFFRYDANKKKVKLISSHACSSNSSFYPLENGIFIEMRSKEDFIIWRYSGKTYQQEKEFKHQHYWIRHNESAANPILVIGSKIDYTDKRIYVDPKGKISFREVLDVQYSFYTREDVIVTICPNEYRIYKTELNKKFPYHISYVKRNHRDITRFNEEVMVKQERKTEEVEIHFLTGNSYSFLCKLKVDGELSFFGVMKVPDQQREKRVEELSSYCLLPEVLLLEVIDFCVL